ncbi:5560_t:CDS:2, partial [Cetraspora pellucida]
RLNFEPDQQDSEDDRDYLMMHGFNEIPLCSIALYRRAYLSAAATNCFGNELLPEIHASLNNLDRLRYLVGQVQNSIYLHEQGVLDLVHAFSSNLDDIREYVQKI